MEDFKISVIVPVYGVEKYIEQCLDSIVGQTYRNLEIILVDDESPDRSGEICLNYAEKDARIRVIRQENAGPGTARNRGFEQASGDYVIFLDSDDWFEAGFLSKMLTRAAETQADITICRSAEYDNVLAKEYPADWMLKEELLPADVFRPEEIRDNLFQFSYGWPWDKLYRMSFLQSSGLRFPPLSNSEDLVFVFPSLALAETIAVLPEVMVHHRVNRMASVSNSRRKNPEVPHRALLLFREALKEHGVYETYERSFINWAMDFLTWNGANMGEGKAQRSFCMKLREEWLPEMQFERYPKTWFDRRVYGKYLLVRYAPYPVFAAILKVYKHMKRWRER